jgi:hypothetical protein
VARQGLIANAVAPSFAGPGTGHGRVLDDEQPGDQSVTELEQQGKLARRGETARLDSETFLYPNHDPRVTPGILDSPEGDQVAQGLEVVEHGGLAGALVGLGAAIRRGHTEHDIPGEAVQERLNVP